MALQSQILAGSPRLDNAAAGGAAVKAAPPRDDPDAVKRIQRALVALGIPLPLSFSRGPAGEPDGQFGQETYKAVLKYQQRAFPAQPSQWDGRVGKNTLAKMDAELPRVGSGGGGATPGPQPLLVVPFQEAEPMPIARRPHSPVKGDLNNKPSTPSLPPGILGDVARTQLENTRKRATNVLEAEMRGELQMAGEAGLGLLNDFILNGVAKSVKTYGAISGNPLAKLVADSDGYKEANFRVRSEISKALTESAATGVLDYRVLHENGRKVSAPLFSYAPKLGSVITTVWGVLKQESLLVGVGSFQGSTVYLEDFSARAETRTYQAKLIYEFFDHFGVDDGDLVLDTKGHGTKGQAALWVLQRERHPGHEPFVVRVVIEEAISDAF